MDLGSVATEDVCGLGGGSGHFDGGNYYVVFGLWGEKDDGRLVFCAWSSLIMSRGCSRSGFCPPRLILS
jgi:hypothetical protein